LARGGLEVGLCLGEKLDLFNDPTLVSIAKKHSKTVAQVVLNFLTSKKIIVLPKTEKIERLKENIDFFNFQLTPEDLQ
jgi:2,5-diketo-D-gluconate reductase A